MWGAQSQEHQTTARAAADLDGGRIRSRGLSHVEMCAIGARHRARVLLEGLVRLAQQRRQQGVQGHRHHAQGTAGP